MDGGVRARLEQMDGVLGKVDGLVCGGSLSSAGLFYQGPGQLVQRRNVCTPSKPVREMSCCYPSGPPLPAPGGGGGCATGQMHTRNGNHAMKALHPAGRSLQTFWHVRSGRWERHANPKIDCV